MKQANCRLPHLRTCFYIRELAIARRLDIRLIMLMWIMASRDAPSDQAVREPPSASGMASGIQEWIWLVAEFQVSCIPTLSIYHLL